MAKIILKSAKEKSILRYHQWIFSGAIKNINGEVREGDIVEVYDNENNYLATGHYQPGSIAVRIFSFKKINPDKTFWKNKFLSAYSLREKLGLTNNPNTTVYRLINAEGDEMPGLIVDYYAGNIVFQAHSVGMFLHRELFSEILREIYDDKLISIYDKSKETLPFKAQVKSENEVIFGSIPQNIIIKENGLNFKIDIETGQKTGFFIDQRENRKLLFEYSNGKEVLNTFSYTGGFSVYAIKGNARYTESIDSSKKAINLLEENISLNFEDTTTHKSSSEDVFKYLQNNEKQWDIIVLDPPAFGKHLDVLDNALKGYRNLNQKAIQKIKPGGLLFTFSCSQVVSKENFRTAIFSASAMAKRKVKILHQLTQPADHPVSIFHPEGEYLKGFVLYVE